VCVVCVSVVSGIYTNYKYRKIGGTKTNAKNPILINTFLKYKM
jgi:hypothetical protein